MDGIQSFLSPSHPSLKICGVTSVSDAEELVSLKVPALGINFWPQSKRYCSPEEALTLLPSLSGQIVRVGVFVNNAPQLAPELLAKNALDIVQLHGDESEEELLDFLAKGIPTIRSLALKNDDNLAAVAKLYRELASTTGGTLALLLDAHAPGLYGGTGETIDWEQAARFIELAAPLPVLLAGGIAPNNATDALATTRPAGLDVASGAESAPGVKDLAKASALLASTQAAPTR